jgi:uncharacterized membrane protein YfcA/uncharacterized membrane protein
MNVFWFTGVLALASVATGLAGSLTGLGGGFILVPVLTLGFGMDLRYAIGASLVSVIATSSGAAAAYVRDGYSNIRVGMFLEIATSIGALVGTFLAPRLPVSALAILFGILMLHTAYLTVRKGTEHAAGGRPGRLAAYLKVDGSYPTARGEVSYRVHHLPGGFVLMLLAGVLSALLGIGSGVVKVVAMDQMMGLPFKVSTTTSSFMIGVTAAASAGVYLNRGYIEPGIAMPVMLGVLAGSILGARILPVAQSRQPAPALCGGTDVGGRRCDLSRRDGAALMQARPQEGVRFETILGNVLRTGVALAALVVAVGAMVYLGGHGAERADYRTFRGEPAELRSVAGLVGSALSGHGPAIIQLGVVPLVATPIARVALACCAFIRERDWRYVAITLVVLGVLAYRLLGSR